MARTATSILAVLLGVTPLAAQQPALPTCTAAEFRQFDFWVGSWVVTDSTGTTEMGKSLVTLEESGCVVHEHWTASKGPTGQSFNFYDRTRNRWEQDWVSSIGNALHLYGAFDGRSMVLTGDPPPKGPQNRITWTLEPDGRVRQLWSQSTDGGKTWTPAFDGWYRRIG